MRLTRAQLQADLRTVTAERDQARTEINQLTADNFELRRKVAEADAVKTENVRLASRLERTEHALQIFAHAHPEFFGDQR